MGKTKAETDWAGSLADLGLLMVYSQFVMVHKPFTP